MSPNYKLMVFMCLVCRLERFWGGDRHCDSYYMQIETCKQ